MPPNRLRQIAGLQAFSGDALAIAEVGLSRSSPEASTTVAIAALAEKHPRPAQGAYAGRIAGNKRPG